jgi:hypothetical protein
MDFMGVTNVTSPSGVFDWTNRTSAMPLITAGQSPRTLDETNVLNALFSPRFNPRTMVLFSTKMEGYGTNAIPATVSEVRVSTHRITFSVETPQPTWAVIAQSFNPNWRATVNGNPVEIVRANFAFQAIPIKEGRSQVKLWYDDRSLNIGMLISGAALLALLAVAVRAP